MDNEFPQIVAELGFNCGEDAKEFGNPNNRIVTINCFNDGEMNQIAFSFLLGRKKGDTVTLIFDSEELFPKLITAILNLTELIEPEKG